MTPAESKYLQRVDMLSVDQLDAFAQELLADVESLQEMQDWARERIESKLLILKAVNERAAKFVTDKPNLTIIKE